MCYYNGQKVARAEYIRLMELEKAVANYDFLSRDLQVGFDYGLNAVIKKTESPVNDVDIVEMEWGFLPPYWNTREQANKYRTGYKNEKGQWVQYLTLNAMGEEMLLPKKMYREAALHRRCLVISSGFFEWQHIFPANKRTGLPVKTAIKYPYHITVKDQPYFFMAGIWTPWTDKETGEHAETFSVVTTTAEGHTLMEQVHNSKKRMPVILEEKLAYEWLFGNITEQRITELAGVQFPTEKMQACSIAKDFRDSINPSAAFQYEELPALIQ